MCLVFDPATGELSLSELSVARLRSPTADPRSEDDALLERIRGLRGRTLTLTRDQISSDEEGPLTAL